MTLLCLDTSTKYSVVAICRSGKLIWGERKPFDRSQSRGIFQLIDKGLSKCRIKLEAIEFLAAGIGPGSFTGLRIGLSAVKGFSMALSKSVVPFSSLDAIAYNASGDLRGYLSVAVDARRRNVYSSLYNADSAGKLSVKNKERLIPVEQWMEKLPKQAVISGDGLRVYADELNKRKIQFCALDEKFWYPTPESVSLAAAKAMNEGRKTDCFGLEALYLYPRDCQVNRKAQ